MNPRPVMGVRAVFVHEIKYDLSEMIELLFALQTTGSGGQGL